MAWGRNNFNKDYPLLTVLWDSLRIRKTPDSKSLHSRCREITRVSLLMKTHLCVNQLLSRVREIYESFDNFPSLET